jgi:hypothetical protein
MRSTVATDGPSYRVSRLPDRLVGTYRSMMPR